MMIPPLLVVLLLVTIAPCSSSSDAGGGRYSFSLSTFDQSGHLAQVEHAARAAALGPPVVAVSLTSDSSSADGSGGDGGTPGVVMASLFSTPNPLIEDDGTARFVRISDTISMSHSGISADGRTVIAAAQRLAVEHAYTFDEEDVPIDLFLEELSALFQRYTMKPGSRPFGCSVLVAHLPSNTSSSSSSSSRQCCRLYRVDPSGVVQMITPICCIGGGKYADKIAEALEERRCAEAATVEEAEAILLDVLRNELEGSSAGSLSEEEKRQQPKLAFLVSSLTRQRGLVVRKVLPPVDTPAEVDSER